MHKKPIHTIIFLVITLIFGLCTSVSAEKGISPEHESALLQLINDARENPLAVASSLGMDTDMILQDFPELKDILTEGLSPLTFNEKLYAAAGGHTQDMLENGYYSHDSPNGRTYSDRIRESGCDPAVTGESLGMLGFNNFIPPGVAVSILFENIFRDELDPARTEKRNILDPDLKEAGIALGTGVMYLGGSLSNIYLLTCNFMSGVEKAETQLLQLINQARENPLAVASSLGRDPDKILQDLPELKDILTEGLPPLTFNENLYAAAGGHSRDMLENGYYSHDSPDGRTYDDRIRESGYDPLTTGESMGLRCFYETAARLLFKKIFTDELRPDSSTERNILNGTLKETGISFIAGTSDELGGGICGDDICLLVADFGSSAALTNPAIVGVVYLDSDQDGLYSQGEGINNVAVTIEGGPYGLFNIYTSEAGGFTVSLSPCEYRVTAMTGECKMVEYVEIGEENKAVSFRVCANPEE